MHWDTTQESWMQDVLDDAITHDYHVIIGVHKSPFNVAQDVSNPFNSIDYDPAHAGGIQQGPEVLVKDFIDGGGHFICYLTGHMHDDYMGVSVSATYANQLVIGVGCANLSASGAYSSMARIANDITQDCFNILSIDTISQTIKLMRIGANYDRFMRRKSALSWNYNTNQIVYCE